MPFHARPQHRGIGRLGFVLICLSAASARSLGASDLVYRPANPAFGGNPNNTTHLLGTANAQNDFTAPQAPSGGSGGRVDQSELFVRQLQSRLLSGLSERVAQAILGTGPNSDNGEVTLGDQTISWTKIDNEIQLSIFNALTGTTTVIRVPDLPDLQSPLGESAIR
jgi:curli production assembly/transport component CsgF